MNRTYFRMTDGGDVSTKRVEISGDEAKYWNDKKWGIFWSVNELEGGYKKSNVKKINSWYCEIDFKEKKLFGYLDSLPAHPSSIIESKNGFHLYWHSNEGTVENYDNIQKRIQHNITLADSAVKDIARILRVPSFYHWKDKNDPFLVTIVSDLGRVYTEEQMINYFPIIEFGESIQFPKTPQYNCRKALTLLSGTEHVNKEVYSFRNNFDGSAQIIVNERVSSCWVDERGLIGSHDRGGPTILQWLKWLDKSSEQIDGAMTFIEKNLKKEVV